MEEINAKGTDRSSEVENRIIELAHSVPIEDEEWLSSQQLHDFIHAWWLLARYYAKNNETVIGVEVISEYVDFARLLRKLMCDSTIDPKIRQQAEDNMVDLDGGIDEVFKEAISHLND